MRKKTTIALGVFTLAALIGTAVFVFRWYYEEPPGVVLYLEFETVGGLHPGAPVRIAGIVSGVVDEIAPIEEGYCRSGTDKPWAVRLTARVDPEMLKALHRDASVYLTTVGPMGEVYVEVDPGSINEPEIHIGDTLCGNTLMRPEDHALRVRISMERLKRHAVTLEEMSQGFDNLSVHARPFSNAWQVQGPVLTESLNNIMTRFEHLSTHPAFDGTIGAEAREVIRSIGLVGESIEKRRKVLSYSVRRISRRAMDTWVIWTQRFGGMDQRVASSLQTLDEIRDDGLVIASRMTDLRTSLGAMASDKEIPNTVKGISVELKQRFWKFLFHGGDPIEIAE